MRGMDMEFRRIECSAKGALKNGRPLAERQALEAEFRALCDSTPTRMVSPSQWDRTSKAVDEMMGVSD